jgi:hypothetical protein
LLHGLTASGESNAHFNREENKTETCAEMNGPQKEGKGKQKHQSWIITGTRKAQGEAARPNGAVIVTSFVALWGFRAGDVPHVLRTVAEAIRRHAGGLLPLRHRALPL